MRLRVTPLGSGSRGNATLVELGDTRVLVDAGLAARTLERRLHAARVEPASLAAILLSHEHQDHARGAELFSRRNGVPVVCPPETLEAMDRSAIHFADWKPLVPARPIDLGGVRIDPFPVPHDAAAPLGFILEGNGRRVGVATDLGHTTTLVVERLRSCDVLVVESNYDPEMLRLGPYPWHLKQRVSGRTGHLSNAETAALLRQIVDERCRAVILAHLSEKNNTPELARRTAGRALADAGNARVAMRVASPRGLTPAVEVEAGE